MGGAAPRRSPVLGRWKVTVRSARTAGSDGSPLERSTAVGVSTATTGMPAARARSMTSTADRIGSRRAPRTPVPSSASTTTAALLDALAEHRDVAGDRQRGPWRSRCRARCGPSSGRRPRPAGRASVATTATMTVRAGEGQAAGRHEAVAAVVARAAQDDDRARSPSDRCRRRAPGPRPRPPSRRAPSAAPRGRRGPGRGGRRRSSPRRRSAACAARSAQRPRSPRRSSSKSVGVVGGQRARPASGARAAIAGRQGGRGHGRPSVADRGPAGQASGRRARSVARRAAASSSRTPSRGHRVGRGADARRGRASPIARVERDPLAVRRRAQAIEDPAAEPAGRRREAAAARSRGRRRRAASRAVTRRRVAPRSGTTARRAGVAARRAAAGRASPRGPSAAWVQSPGRSGGTASSATRLELGAPSSASASPADDPPEHAPDVDVDRADRQRRTRSPRRPARCTARRRGAPRAPATVDGTCPPCSSTMTRAARHSASARRS